MGELLSMAKLRGHFTNTFLIDGFAVTSFFRLRKTSLQIYFAPH